MTAKHAEPEPLLLTVEEAARRLRLSRSSMFLLLKAGDIKSVTIGSRRRIALAELVSYTERLAAGGDGGTAA